MPTPKTHSTLFIRDLELNINLGWRTAERKLEQAVLLNMEIHFPKQPKACASDNLDDTVCYADLINEIRQKIAKKHYRLIEHLSAEIFQIAKSFLPSRSKLSVAITKYPKIDGLRGGVSFVHGDD